MTGKSNQHGTVPARLVGVNRRSPTVMLLAVGLLVVSLLGVGVRMADVHSQTRDWRLTVAAAPTRLAYRGGAYLRAGLMTSATEPAGGTLSGGLTEGGGQILIPKIQAAEGSSLTWLIVKDGGREYSYSLMGGG